MSEATDNQPGGDRPRPPTGPRRLGLSGKLLLMTIPLAMIAGMMIYVPAIANFRVNRLNDRLAASECLADLGDLNHDLLPLEYRALMPTIDIDIGAHDKACAFRGEKCDRTGDVLGFSPSPEWNLSTPTRFLLLQAASEKNFVVKFQAVSQRGLDAARAHCIDQDIVAREVVRKRLHQSVLSGIADGRSDPVGLRHFARLTDDDNNPSTTLATHMRHDAFGQFPCPHHLRLQVIQ